MGFLINQGAKKKRVYLIFFAGSQNKVFVEGQLFLQGFFQVQKLVSVCLFREKTKVPVLELGKGFYFGQCLKKLLQPRTPLSIACVPETAQGKTVFQFCRGQDSGIK